MVFFNQAILSFHQKLEKYIRRYITHLSVSYVAKVIVEHKKDKCKYSLKIKYFFSTSVPSNKKGEYMYKIEFFKEGKNAKVKQDYSVGMQ